MTLAGDVPIMGAGTEQPSLPFCKAGRMPKKDVEQARGAIGARSILSAFAHGYGAALDLTGSLFLSRPGRFFQAPARAYRQAARRDWSRAIERAALRHRLDD